MNKIVIIHEEYMRLKEQQKDALERLSRLICVYDDMILQQKPHLEALYAESFGALEQACYASYVQEAALRRKIDLVRMYLNRDAEPDFGAIEEKLHVEFQEYEEELRRMEIEHQTALMTLSAKGRCETAQAALSLLGKETASGFEFRTNGKGQGAVAESDGCVSHGRFDETRDSFRDSRS